MTHIIDRQQRELPLLLTDERVLTKTICECNDKFIDIATVNNEYIKMLPVPSQPFVDITHNAGLVHSSFIRSLLFKRLEAAVNNFNRIYKGVDKDSKIVFMVFEGLRSLEDCRNAGPYKDVDIYNEQKATGGFVSFRLFDESIDEFLDLGEVDSDITKVYVTFSKHLTAVQKRNRTYLLHACAMAGLVNYPLEWWTFCFGTQYYSYYTDNRVAIFDKIERNSQIVKTD